MKINLPVDLMIVNKTYKVAEGSEETKQIDIHTKEGVDAANLNK